MHLGDTCVNNPWIAYQGPRRILGGHFQLASRIVFRDSGYGYVSAIAPIDTIKCTTVGRKQETRVQ